MKSVLISIKPKWCELIASGKKTIEVRKTRPKCDTPFKCYIYCTLSELLTRSHYNSKIYVATNKKYQNELERVGNTTLSGKVIGEFICNKIDRLAVCGYNNSDMKLRRVDDNLTAYNLDYDYLNKCRLSLGELKNYANGSKLFGWHISDLVIYDKPKDLDDFMAFGKTHCDQKNCGDCLYMGIDGICDVKDIGQPMTRPPQSWCYVEEEVENGDV
jgi:predicted transcriptional regulator|nr:MAG TPA: helix-turn-helix domain-containing protein [Caudoviricetes sp.]